VWSNIPGRETPFLGPVALAPGEVLPYVGMFEVPADFCGTDTVTVEGFSLCGNRRVEASDVSSCPVELSPKLVVRNHCATSPIRHGQQANFSGSVSNVGDSVLRGVTIRNQMVVANHPEQTDTPVTGPMDIAPGETIVFDYTLMIPDDRNCCEIIHSLIASGKHPCEDSLIQSTSTVVCPIETHPSLSVVLDCVTTPHAVGDWVTYHGWIENNGDISLEALNVEVVNGPAHLVMSDIHSSILSVGEKEVWTLSYEKLNDGPLPPIQIRATARDICQDRMVSDIAACHLPQGMNRPIRIQSVSHSGGEVRVVWKVQPHMAYRIKQCAQLTGEWAETGTAISSADGLLTWQSSMSHPAQMFFRLESE